MPGTVSVSMSKMPRSFWVVEIFFRANHCYRFFCCWFLSGSLFFLTLPEMISFLFWGTQIWCTFPQQAHYFSFQPTYWIPTSFVGSLWTFFFLFFLPFCPWSLCLFLFLNLIALGVFSVFIWMNDGSLIISFVLSGLLKLALIPAFFPFSYVRTRLLSSCRSSTLQKPLPHLLEKEED